MIELPFQRRTLEGIGIAILLAGFIAIIPWGKQLGKRCEYTMYAGAAVYFLGRLGKPPAPRQG